MTPEPVEIPGGRVRPYKLVSYEPGGGAAHVIDRGTGELVGYVLATFNAWEAFTMERVGDPIVFATVKWTDPRIVEVMGRTTHDVKSTRYRRDAAEKVWEVARGSV